MADYDNNDADSLGMGDDLSDQVEEEQQSGPEEQEENDELQQEEEEEEEEDVVDIVQSAIQYAAGDLTDNRPRKSKRTISSNVPKPQVQRLQRSYIVRDVRSKYPTEIENAVRRPGLSLDENMSEPVRSFLGILREYMGYDPSTLDFETIEDRMMRSSKAADESDSEHYQRLMSALNILNEIKQSRVVSMSSLIELAQKDLNDDRQHKRFEDAIRVKRDKADSEISKARMETRLVEQELLVKRRRESHLGFVLRELEAAEARSKLVLLTDFPHRPMNASQIPRGLTNFDRRLAYVRAKLSWN